jgi:hypothetical protein
VVREPAPGQGVVYVGLVEQRDQDVDVTSPAVRFWRRARSLAAAKTSSSRAGVGFIPRYDE